MTNQKGGGYGSRVVTERPVKTGRGNLGVSVGRVGQLGQMQGDHVTHKGESTGYRGEGPIHQGAALRPALMGNEVAAKTVCGPGGSREVMKSGQQGMHGAVNPGLPADKSAEPNWPIWRK